MSLCPGPKLFIASSFRMFSRPPASPFKPQESNPPGILGAATRTAAGPSCPGCCVCSSVSLSPWTPGALDPKPMGPVATHLHFLPGKVHLVPILWKKRISHSMLMSDFLEPAHSCALGARPILGSSFSTHAYSARWQSLGTLSPKCTPSPAPSAIAWHLSCCGL